MQRRNSDYRHYWAGMVTGLFLLAVAGYFYCTNCQFIAWQHVCAAIAVCSGISYARLTQPSFHAVRVEILDAEKIAELRYLRDVEFQNVMQHHRFMIPHLLLDLGAAIREAHMDEVLRVAARIRSSGKSFGALRFAVLAQSIEDYARAGDLEKCSLIFQEICTIYPGVDAALEAVGARA